MYGCVSVSVGQCVSWSVWVRGCVGVDECMFVCVGEVVSVYVRIVCVCLGVCQCGGVVRQSGYQCRYEVVRKCRRVRLWWCVCV